ncbi:phospholipid transporting ATPase, partial [Coemansia sp. RSA 1933]
MTKLNGSLHVFSAPAVPEEGEDAFSSGPNDVINPVSPFQTVTSAVSPLQAAAHANIAAAYGNFRSDDLYGDSSNNSNSYEMRMLGSGKQAQQYIQSPLAKRPSGGIPEFHGDDEPAYEQKTVGAGSPTKIALGKSLPFNVDYSSDPRQVPFSITNVLLRGMTIRNTDWVVGLVLYTGEQTKIVLNSGPTPFKRSRIERTMNTQVMLSFGFVFVSSFIVALVGGLKYAKPEHRYSLYVDTSMGTGLYGFALFWSAMIMLQNVIPIALYVSIEFVKSWHAYWIYQDINMYYEPTNQRCAARNWNISDDLGQVSYIFSDKTGTLTRNVMDFRMCSVGGRIYGKQLPGDELDVVKGRIAQEEVDRNNPPEGGPNPFFAEIQDDESNDFAFSTNVDAYADAGLAAAAQHGGRQSDSTSIASIDTGQYDSSPLISTTDSAYRRQMDHMAHPPRSPAAPAPSGVPVAAARSRSRTHQTMSAEEMEAKRKKMIHAYVGAMRKVFAPQYVEIGNEDTGDGGAYTFVDPQLFYDMKPEVAPAAKVKRSVGAEPGSQALDILPAAMRRTESQRSIADDPDYDPLRQRDMVDLFLTELATCHTVVVEKNFQKHINNADDDQSTIRRLTRIFHSRSGSRKITDMVRHRRHRSKHHGRTDSTATFDSTGGGG